MSCSIVNDIHKLRPDLKDDPVLNYYRWICSGKNRVNQKVRKEYEKQVRDILKSVRGEWEWEYSPEHGRFIVDFIERFCKHSKSKWAGKPVTLELWQRAWVMCAYGFIHGVCGGRKHTECHLFIPRKSGKSLLASCLALYHFVMDGEAGAEIYSAATTYQQARITYDESMKMIKKSPKLSSRIKVKQTDMTSGDSKFRPLAADSHSLDGLNASLVIADEIHAWEGKGGMALYDVLKDSMIARVQPMMIVISTMGVVRGSAFDVLYDLIERKQKGYDDSLYVNERMFSVVYELDDPKVNIHKREMWAMCNPMLGITFTMDALEEKYEKAMQLSTELPNLLTKHFNVRSSSSVSWMQFQDYNNAVTWSHETHHFRYAIGGVDLSQTQDWTAACLLMKRRDDKTFYYKHHYWVIRQYFDDNPDKLPLQAWEEQGLLTVINDIKIDHNEVGLWFVEQQAEHNIYMFKIGYDRYAADMMVATIRDNLGDITVPIAQGALTLSSPMHYLGKMLKAKMINYQNNPITKLHIGNTVVKTDDNGNIKPIKGSDNKKKIDGLAAMLNAMTVYTKESSWYDTMI